jgi:two-component system sensor histidine kinase UhpB
MTVSHDRLYGLRAQVLLWTMLPLSILLIIFSVTGVQGHHAAMKNLATQENSRLVLALAQVIALELENVSLREDISVEQIDADQLDLAQWLTIEHVEAESAVMLLNADRELLFRWGTLLPDGEPETWTGVSEALLGQHAVVFTSDTSHGEIVAYAPIPNRNWALVIRESWHALTAPLIRYEQVLPFILFIAFTTSGLILFFGVRFVVQPLHELGLAAARIGKGEFDAARTSIRGVREIEALRRSLNDMADQVRNHQAALRDYLGAVNRAQEEERARLARELHDETVQSLIALGHKAQMTQRFLSRDPEAAKNRINELREMIAQAIEEVRRFSRALHPHYLEELGLVAALETLSRDAKAEFVFTGTLPHLSPDRELAMYRIAQEAVNNALRHAHATCIRVELAAEQTCISLRVHDDGIGFRVPTNFTDLTRSGHFGLIGMRERAALVNASLQFAAQPGKGTSVTLDLPPSLCSVTDCHSEGCSLTCSCQ